MSNLLTNKGNVIISAAATPTSTEIANQFAPKSVKPSFESLANENSGRSDDGEMHISWIINAYRKWEIELPPCTVEFASSILSKVQGRLYYITVWDVLTNAEVTRYVYTSNSAADWYSGIVYNGLIQGASFSAIDKQGVTY